MANIVTHTYSWDVTSDVLSDWIYEGYAKKYVFDEDIGNWMREVNPWAAARIAETLLEAIRRGYWNAAPETEAALRSAYLLAEGEAEGGC